MKRIYLLGPFVVVMEAASAVCAWPGAFGIWSRPNYWGAGFGTVLVLLVLAGWLVIALSERQLDDAVDVTAEITTLLMNNPCEEAEIKQLVEPDPRFEQNSGLMRWKKKGDAMMRIIPFLVVVLSMVLTGCQAVATPVEDTFDGPVVILATPSVVGSAAPTPSLTVKGTPTVDYQAKIGESDLRLHQSVASATVAAITQQVIDTAQAKLDVSNVKTGTAVVAKTQTFEVQAIQTQDMLATGTAQSPYIAREWVRTSWEPVIQAAYCTVILLVGIFLCWAIYALAQAKYKLIIAQAALMNAAQVPEIEPESDDRLNVQLDRRDEYGWGAVEWSTLPISREILSKVAELIVLHGARYNQAQMTGSGKPLIKDNTFDSFGAWMRVNKIALRLEDGRYIIQRREFFEQVLR